MAKIHVNLHQGIIDIEGDEDFVRATFKEIQGVISAFDVGQQTKSVGVGVATDSASAPHAPPGASSASGSPKPKAATKPKAKAASAKSGTSGVDKYFKGTFDPTLDMSDLKAYYAQYNPASALTRNLVFAAFLRDKLGRSPCSANDIFSCYYAMKSEIKIPVAFGKSLSDSRNEGYITFTSADDVDIPIFGENYLGELLKKAGS